MGTLLTLKSGQTESVYLLGLHERAKVSVKVNCKEDPGHGGITPQSPIGRQLVGKIQGESIVLPTDPEKRQFKIIRVR